MSEAVVSRSRRIEGYDLARALAIIGMVFVNFRVVLMVVGVDVEAEGPAGWFSEWITGRAAATFVVLAGVGIALLARRAMEDEKVRTAARRRLAYRALFLAAIGWPFLVVWEGDILHYYAAFFLFGALVFPWRLRWHLTAAAVLSLLFLLVLPVWPRNWDFATITYRNLWTWEGQLMNLFVNGFHPLIPWLAFVSMGLALGRFLLERPEAVGKTGLIALVIAVTTEAAFAVIASLAGRGSLPGGEPGDMGSLLGTSSMPPMPQYVLAAGSFAVALICACRLVGDAFAGHWFLRPFTCLGQMALTVYIVHVFAGVFPLFVIAMENPGAWSLGKCVFATTVFSIMVMAGATLWRRWLPRGPAEWLMRRFSDHRDRRRWLALASAVILMGLLVAGTLATGFSGRALPDEKEFTQRCTRWVLGNPLFKARGYKAWTEKHFGSKKEFEDEWLTRLYFEYAGEGPMEDAAFSEWVTEKVREQIRSREKEQGGLDR